MKICPVGAKSFHAEGQRGRKTGGKSDGWTGRQTDMTKLIVAFRNFPNAPKKLFERNFMFCWPAFLYNLVNKANFVQNVF
jgi:hypothetical protein